MGINSGLVYALLNTIVVAFLADNTVSIVTIGFISMIMLPYSLKYLWSTAVDSVRIKIFPVDFGQRKSWMFLMQSILIVLVSVLGYIDIDIYFPLFTAILVLIAILGASFDISLVAYRIELFNKKNEQATGTRYNMIGFRVGLIISSVVGVYLSSLIAWRSLFLIIAIIMVPCLIITYFSIDKSKAPHNPKNLKLKYWLKNHLLAPLKDLSTRPQFVWSLLLISFYKLSDSFVYVMSIPFLLHIGYSKLQIASAANLPGIIASIVGVYCGSLVLKRFKIITYMIVAELLAAITNLLFIILIYLPPNNIALVSINICECFCSGLCGIAFICYISSLCNKKFTATQYAILISAANFSRIIISSLSGVIVVKMGWSNFFIISTLISIPSLICLYVLYKSQK